MRIDSNVGAITVDYPAATHVLPGLIDIPEDTPVVIHGFVKSVRKTGKSLVFMDVIQYTRGPIFSVQAISQISAASTDEQKALHDSLSKIPVFTPVAVTGRILLSHTSRPEIKLESLVRLNSVSKDIIFTDETVFPPEKRHLQLRTEKHLQNALRLRHKAAIIVRNNLNKADFMEVETPLLFKSTPEGAREFLVPTRSKENGGGMCYALPQSPQQYKQILMASGVSKYYQFAKCFRDEDLRADRQPEFTQIDLEMAFARQEDVILAIEKLIRELWTEVLGIELPLEFRRMTYQEAMMSYGSDKPDLRFKHLRIYVAQYGPMDREGWYKYRANTFYIRAPSAWPEEMRLKKIKALQEELIAENPRLVSYIASEETANGVPEHNLSAADVETINERMNILTGDLVLLTKAKHLTVSCASHQVLWHANTTRAEAHRWVVSARRSSRRLWPPD